jgi:5-dehydro-2-deoxygluconokinase
MVAEADDVSEAIGRLRRWGVPLVVAKMGAEGVRAETADEVVFQAAYQVEVVSTIGAGDGFASGFLYALLQEKPLAAALAYGNAAAAIVCTRLMCSDAMPTLAEVEGFLAAR